MKKRKINRAKKQRSNTSLSIEHLQRTEHLTEDEGSYRCPQGAQGREWEKGREGGRKGKEGGG